MQDLADDTLQSSAMNHLSEQVVTCKETSCLCHVCVDLQAHAMQAGPACLLSVQLLLDYGVERTSPVGQGGLFEGSYLSLWVCVTV